MKDLSCEKARSLMILSVYGEAGRECEDSLSGHILKCPGCLAEQEGLKKMYAHTKLMHATEIPEALLSGIKAKCAEISAAKNRPFLSRKLLSRPVYGLTAAAVALFVLVMLIRPAVRMLEVSTAGYEDYMLIDEQLVKAENLLETIHLDMLAGLDLF